MKYAVFSDIHSNVFALDACLEHAAIRQVDQRINLGDFLYGPIAPEACYRRLKKLSVISIRGNQDREIYLAREKELAQSPCLNFVNQDLSAEAMHWLSSLPFDQVLGDKLYLCHGTPERDDQHLCEDIYTSQLHSAEALSERLKGITAELILCGHSHIPRNIQLSNGQRIVNPGSVGLPAYCDAQPVKHSMENGSNDARYAIVEKAQQGWLVEHISVPYDFESAAKAAERNDRGDWAYALRHGRVLTEV
jgi:predicted phosphodiesterase